MPPNVVLTQFKGDATSFIAAVHAMQAAMTQLNTSLNTVTTSNQKVAASTKTVASDLEKTKASTIAFGSVMGQLALKALSWGKSMASSFSDTAIETRKLQMIMGGTAEEMSGLIAVAGAYKVPFDALIVSYRTFAIQALSNTKAFRDLHLSLRDVNGAIKPATQLFGEAADALNKLKTETERTGAGGILFGRRFKELTPILALGSQGIKDLAENMKKMGLVLTEDGVKKGVAFTLSQTQMHQALQGLSFTVMTEVVPSLTKLVQWVTYGIVSFKDYLKQNPQVIKGIKDVALAFLGLYAAVKLYGLAQQLVLGLQAAAGIGRALVGFGVWVAATVTGYGSVAAAASTAAAASLSAWAATGIGLVVVGAAVAGVAIYIDKMFAKINSSTSKMNLPSYTPPGAGTEDYSPTGAGSAGPTGKTKAQKDAEARKKKMIADAKANLDVVKEFWDAQVKAAKDALEITKSKAKEYADYVKEISDTISKSAEIPSMIEESFAQYLGPSNLVNLFKRKVQDAKDFLSALTQLRDDGLDPGILAQLAAAGPQAGLSAAKVILSDVGVISDLNSLQAQLTSFAGKTAETVAGYVKPDEYAASIALPAAQTKYDTAVTGQTAGVASAEADVKKAERIKITVNANTNANPNDIASQVAFTIKSGMRKNAFSPSTWFGPSTGSRGASGSW
jgi:hypothetical protein